MSKGHRILKTPSSQEPFAQISRCLCNCTKNRIIKSFFLSTETQTLFQNTFFTKCLTGNLSSNYEVRKSWVQILTATPTSYNIGYITLLGFTVTVRNK